MLRAAGFSFDVFPVDVDERFGQGEKPEHAVARLAETKANAAAASHPDAVVLGADTTVVIRGEALAKPASADDATRMLRLLSGRTHACVGLCVLRFAAADACRPTAFAWRHERTEIPGMSRRGPSTRPACAVQGWRRFVEGSGSYSNVVGLPISSVYDLLKELGCDIVRSEKSP